MLKIRLQRIGRINMPSYRLIVVEHTEGPKTGKFTDIVGTYNPRAKERKLDEAKIKHWLSVGAQPSDTVHNMLVTAGIINAKKINVLPKYVEPKKEEAPADATSAPQAAEAPADSTSSPQAAEAPAPEKAAEAAEEAAPEAPAEEPKAEEQPQG